jgi:deoxycytidylate deaminase
MAQQQLTALIYNKRGRLLSVGQNSYVRTHPLQARAAREVGKPASIYLHAEIAALVRLKDWSKAHKLVVLRYTKDGQPAKANPCDICKRVIKLSGIKIIEST